MANYMVFKAITDWFYRVVFYTIFSLNFYIIDKSTPNNDFLVFLIALFLLLFTGWIWFGTKYVITDDILLILAETIKQTSQTNQIHNIRKMKNPFPSVSLELERLEINDHP